MIFDDLRNADRYRRLAPGLGTAFDFLRAPGLAQRAAGRHAVRGDRIYAIVAREQGRRRELAPLEVHRAFIDVQYVLAGTDTMGWKPLADCRRPAGRYNAARDIRFFGDAPDAWIAVPPGCFAVFFPQDAHAPLVSDGDIQKVVVKVRVTGA